LFIDLRLFFFSRAYYYIRPCLDVKYNELLIETRILVVYFFFKLSIIFYNYLV